jgi:hypothetical protein
MFVVGMGIIGFGVGYALGYALEVWLKTPVRPRRP